MTGPSLRSAAAAYRKSARDAFLSGKRSCPYTTTAAAEPTATSDLLPGQDVPDRLAARELIADVMKSWHSKGVARLPASSRQVRPRSPNPLWIGALSLCCYSGVRLLGTLAVRSSQVVVGVRVASHPLTVRPTDAISGEDPHCSGWGTVHSYVTRSKIP